MNRYQAAERVAQVIFQHGWSYLSDSENDALNRDHEFSGAVQSILEKLRRARLLRTDDDRVRAIPDPFEGLSSLALAQWELTAVAREAQLWGHTGTKRIVLEVKEWPLDAFHGAVSTGAHQLVFQKSLTGSLEALLEESLGVLVEHTCPDDRRAAFQTAARAALTGPPFRLTAR